MRKAFACLFVITVCGAFAFGQDVRIKDQKAFFYAYLECSGPYAQMQAKIGEFMAAYFSQNLGPITGLIALYLNAPDQVPEAELKWRIGAPIGKETEPAAPLQKDVFDHPQVAYALYIGPYDKISETYGKISAYIDQNGWRMSGPPMEMYLDNPEETAPEELRTEIFLPVVKK